MIPDAESATRACGARVTPALAPVHAAPSASCRGKTPRKPADQPGPPSGAAIGRKQICDVRSDGISHVSSFRLAPGSFESKQAVSRCAQTEFGLTLVAHGAIADVEAGMNFS